VGMLCPNCRVLCHGASDLEAHIACCEGGSSSLHDAPGGNRLSGSVIVLFIFKFLS